MRGAARLMSASVSVWAPMLAGGLLLGPIRADTIAVGIVDHAHQALSVFLWARRSARTSLTASSTMPWISSGSASALRSLMS